MNKSRQKTGTGISFLISTPVSATVQGLPSTTVSVNWRSKAHALILSRTSLCDAATVPEFVLHSMCMYVGVGENLTYPSLSCLAANEFPQIHASYLAAVHLRRIRGVIGPGKEDLAMHCCH